MIVALVFAAPAQARKTQAVVLSTFFENKDWFPLTKKEMERAVVDNALQELTRANVVELTTEDDVLAGRLSVEIQLVERAETLKVTISFTALKVPSAVTSASANLHGLTYEGIFQAMSAAGREAGRKMRERLIAVIPPDAADKALTEMLGKDWDNMTTSRLYSKAQELKRADHYDEAKELFKSVGARKDRGSQQWKRLADDELIYGLPLYQAQHELMAAAEHRRSADLKKIEALCRTVVEKNTGNEARTAEAQKCLDMVAQLKGAMGMVDRSEIKSRVRALQTAMAMQYMETARAPKLEELKSMSPDLFTQADIKDFKADDKSGDYSFEIVLKNNGASGRVKGNLMRAGGEGIEFKEPAPAQ